MSALSPQPVEECLDIAVDHRIRALFKPVHKQIRFDVNGNHGRYLTELAVISTHRTISKHEIEVTQQFLGPECTGGVAVVLLQPSNFHPYWEGQDSVVRNCRTFSFLDEGFRAVTCGSIGLDSQMLSIVDSAPYTRPKDSVSVEYKKHMRQWASRIIREKKPDVVLCMWQDKEGVPLKMTRVRSLGIGRDFDSSRISFDGSPMDRVNSFHPSYVANHNPYVSCFRQLLLLNIARACWMYERRSWHEEEWMCDLKNRCMQKAKSIGGRLSLIGSESQGKLINGAGIDKRFDNTPKERHILNTYG